MSKEVLMNLINKLKEWMGFYRESASEISSNEFGSIRYQVFYLFPVICVVRGYSWSCKGAYLIQKDLRLELRFGRTIVGIRFPLRHPRRLSLQFMGEKLLDD